MEQTDWKWLAFLNLLELGVWVICSYSAAWLMLVTFGRTPTEPFQSDVLSLTFSFIFLTLGSKVLNTKRD
jgi:hypothetical protein